MPAVKTNTRVRHILGRRLVGGSVREIAKSGGTTAQRALPIDAEGPAWDGAELPREAQRKNRRSNCQAAS